MARTKELPNPPGGLLTCEDGQFPTVTERSDSGEILCRCHNFTPPPPGSPGQYLIPGSPYRMKAGIVDYTTFIGEFDDDNGIDTVYVADRWIPVYQLSQGLHFVTQIPRPFGGVSPLRIARVVMAGEFVRSNGDIVRFDFKRTEDDELDPMPLRPLMR